MQAPMGDSSRQAQSFLVAPRSIATGSSSNSILKDQVAHWRACCPLGGSSITFHRVNEHSIPYPPPRVKGGSIKTFGTHLFLRSSQSSKILSFSCKLPITFGGWDSLWFACWLSWPLVHFRTHGRSHTGKMPRGARSIARSLKNLSICQYCKSFLVSQFVA